MDIGSITWTVEANTSKLDNARDDMDRVGNEAKKTGRDAKKMGDDIKKAGSKAKKATNDMDNGFKKVNTSSKSLTKSIVGLATAIGAVQFAKATVQANLALESINSSLMVATGSAQGAAREYKFLRDESQRLGLDLRTSADAFSSLAAAARGTSLEGKDTRDIFVGVSEAMTALGRDSYATEGALRAIEQMISKGNVQAEELRGQLGERLPGAFQLAARAMGVTTQELNKMLEDGEVLAADLLPRLATELTNTFGAQATAKAKGLQAEINRFKTAVFDLMTSGNMQGLASSIRDVTTLIANPEFQKGFAAFVSGIVQIAGFGAKAVAAIGNLIPTTQEQMKSALDQEKRLLDQLKDEYLKPRILRINPLISTEELGKQYDDQREKVKQMAEALQKFIWMDGTANPDITLPTIEKPKPVTVIDDEAQKAYDKAISSIKDLNLELIYQTEMLGMTDAEMLKYRLTVGDLSDEIELLGDVGINYRDSILKQAQALDAAKLAQEAETKAKEEAKSILDDLKTPMDDYIERLKKITELEQLGELTAEQASRARDKARGDFEKGQQETADKVTDFWKTATENIQNELADNLFDFMQGEFDFSADGFKRMLDRMVADALAADIAGALFPSSLGGEGGGSGLLGDLFNFASSSTANTEQFGGEFAPQSSTTDFFGSIADFFTSFDGGGYSGDGSRSGGMDGKGGFPAMLHPQETVIDHTKGGGGVVVNINVSGVTDEGTLKKTAAQIAQQSGMAAQRATARNG